MYYSIFELFKIGVGPSSSHTVGPINAANLFLNSILKSEHINNIKKINVELMGSLAYTAHGHKTIDGILIGLTGTSPESVDKRSFEKIKNIKDNKKIQLTKECIITFKPDVDIILNKNINKRDKYNNVMVFKCFYSHNDEPYEKTYYSIGGGFIVEKGIKEKRKSITFPYNFNSSNELLKLCKDNDLNIYDIIISNELALNKNINNLNSKVLNLWDVMNDTIKSGISKTGTIDKILNVERRANKLYNKLKRKNYYDPLEVLDWVNIFAISTCEENASGSKIVTAPTNGAAGIIPAVLKYYKKFTNDSNDEGIIRFLATSAAIGILFKNNSSISGAEVGCQGEVGVACSMAAAGLTAALGGTSMQIENAAEIGMEHNLGLTCDPIKGLVQIPCIERNSMGAIKAINASRLALSGSGEHKVTLDQVIKTMNETGKSMNSIYKETALGGLAVNVIEC